MAVIPIVNNMFFTGQAGYGRAVISQGGDFNLMAWNGTDADHSLNVATTGADSLTFPSASTGLAGSTNPMLNGPAIAVLPNGAFLYVAWVNASNKVAVTRFPRVDPPDGSTVSTWNFSTPPVWVFQQSSPAGAPTMLLNVYSGALVLQVIWQDNGANSMVMGTVYIGDEDAPLYFDTLNQPCTGQPFLSGNGTAGGPYLAWANSTGNDTFSLSLCGSAKRGGLQTNLIGTVPGVGGAWGVAYLPLGPTQGYAVWANEANVHYQGVARNQTHQWVLNPNPACAGTFGVGAPTAPPYPFFWTEVTSGVTSRYIALAYPQNGASERDGDIWVALFPPVQSAVPVA